MRRLITLFISLFLSSNYFNANAESHIVKNYPIIHQVLENSEQQDLVTKSDDFSIFKANRINERSDEIISEENDDDDFVSVKRYNLTTNYFGIFIYAFVLSFFYQLKMSVLPFGKHLSYIFSYKYILLRVLKI
jgi:hypothetical protein